MKCVRVIVLLFLAGAAGGAAPAAVADVIPGGSLASRSHAVVARLALAACGSTAVPRVTPVRALPPAKGPSPCAALTAMAGRGAGSRFDARAVDQINPPDGTLIERARLAADATAAIDVVTYASDGLIVGGIVCYPNDGQPHSAIIHVHGGTGGIFVNPDGDMVQTCWNWALSGHTAFAPSLRGQDGGEGQLELCLGEADDVVAGATMLRGLGVTDPDHVALVGGSVGGCIALRAGPRIPRLAAVVAFVPPTSWKDLVQFHTTSFVPATETTCDGAVVPWDVGGPPVATVIDEVICGKVGCSDDDYNARSPLAYVAVQSAPTLIVSAVQDNLITFWQEVLYSIDRQSLGYPLTVNAVSKCDPPATPALGNDVNIVVVDGFHSLAAGPIETGMLFMLAELDGPRAPEAPSAGLEDRPAAPGEPAGGGAIVRRASARKAGTIVEPGTRARLDRW